MKKTSVVFIFILLVIACSKSDSSSPSTPAPAPAPTPTPTPTLNCSGIDSKFSSVVSVIIQNSCNITACHNAGSTNGPGPLTNFNQISAAATAIRNAVEAGRMPKTGSLTDAQKNAISCWVASGAPNN